MPVLCALSAFLSLAFLIAAPAAAQEQPTEDAAAATASPAPGDPARNDIVVNGIRLRDPADLPVSVQAPTEGPAVLRVLSSESISFARCAGLPRLSLLRRIVDGRPETADTQMALHQHIMRHSGCFQDIPLRPPYPHPPYFGACNPRWINNHAKVCRADYDRGFVFEQALSGYAPQLRLSRSNTFDHATRDHFRTREELRNGARGTGAADYFYAAACMVQLRPEYALALLREAPGSDAEAKLRAMIISDGTACLGGSESVSVIPGQFRAFLAEAVYSWAVAVQRADSLLPTEDG